MAASVLMVRREARGTDYQAGDIVQVFDAYQSDGVTLQTFVLPPAAPFAFVKIEGLTMAEALTLATSVYVNGTLLNKRRWGVQIGAIPIQIRQFFLAHWFVGFGGAGDVALYGAVVDGDTVIQWATAQTWLQSKV